MISDTQSNFVSAVTSECAEKYNKCLEELLREIGVTEESASEYEIRTCYGEELNSEIWHNGVRVGKIAARWETGDALRFVVEARALVV